MPTLPNSCASKHVAWYTLVSVGHYGNEFLEQAMYV